MKLLPYLGLLMGLASLGYGVPQLFNQRRLVEQGRPVQVMIESSEVESNFNGHLMQYKPVIHYHYAVDGRTYDSHGVFPTSDEGSESWAQEIVRRFPPGSIQTAYSDPLHPDKSFLIRRYTADPYVTVSFGLIMLAFGPFLFLHLRAKDSATLPRDRGDGWYVLEPAWNLQRYGPVLTIAGIVYAVIGVLLLGDFYRHAFPPYGILAIAYTIFYGLVFLTMLGGGLFILISGRDVGQTVVSIDSAIVRRGDRRVMRLEQTFWRAMSVRDAMVKLQCFQEKFVFHGTSGSSHVNSIYKNEAKLVEGSTLREGESIAHEHALGFPAYLPATTRRRWWTSPRHFWRIDVKFKFVGRLPYGCQYYVRVNDVN